MSRNVAPWLQGLDEDVVWEAPVTVSSASHDASSSTENARKSTLNQSRMQRRSLSGAHRNSSFASGSVQRKRNPLATISNNDHSIISERLGAYKQGASRSVSVASSGSVLQCGTVQQRPKSSSPGKKQDTLEWKRRLVHGQVGYGDQTDLFGPSGLENIFAQPQSTDRRGRKPRNMPGRIEPSAIDGWPSSPPAWPTLCKASSSEDLAGSSPFINHAHLNAVDGANDEEDSELPGISSPDQDTREPIQGLAQRVGEGSFPGTNLLQPPGDFDVGNRTIGGPTELEQEDFSPVFISKHTTVTGHVDYRALDSRTAAHMQERDEPNTESLDEIIAGDDLKQEDSCLPGDISQDQPDLSLSENLPTGTPPGSALGSHVEITRGGYSAQGSFNRRPLSPSASTTGVSAAEDRTTIRPAPVTSDAFLPAPPTPPQLTTPARPERSPEHAKSSGSPLKLFAAHDTFTNQRLLRRISQLDVGGSDTFKESRTKSRNVSGASFGSGALDKHGFDAEVSISISSISDGNDSAGSPGSEILPPGSTAPVKFRMEETDPEIKPFKLKSKIPRRTGAPLSSVGNTPTRPMFPKIVEADTSNISASRIAVKRGAGVPTAGLGKRPQHSPCKDSTPKRRRTLHASEIHDEADNTTESLNEMSYAAPGKLKRRDSRQGPPKETADPEVLADRKLLHPRVPSSSQLKQQDIRTEIRKATEHFAAQEPEKLEAVIEQIESSMATDDPLSVQEQAQVVATEVAKFTLRVQKASGDYSERKRSVTTQDFFNEAVMVMKLIREKAGRQSALGSVVESEQERLSGSFQEDLSELSNSALSVSRPPSREGGVAWRPRTSQQTDARVVSHLRRFQERDETEYISQSLASVGITDDDEPEVMVEDEISNIRIKGPLPSAQYGKPDRDTNMDSQGSHAGAFASQSTQGSGTTSMGRTLYTSSTRKSENVKTLAPDAVAHLIGQQVGGMTFDKEKNQWVKARTSPQKPKCDQNSFLDIPSSLSASDEDPFREISDLPIDEQKEEQIRSASYDFKRHLEAHRTASQPLSMAHEQDFGGESRTTAQKTAIKRPTTSDSHKSMQTYTTADRTQNTGLGSSQTNQVETRATSWSNEELHHLSGGTKTASHLVQNLALDEPNLEAQLVSEQQSRAEMDESQAHESAADSFADSELSRDDLPQNTVLSSPKLRQGPFRPAMPPAPTLNAPAQYLAQRRQTLLSQIQDEYREHSEVSLVAALPGERTMSVSLSVSRPVGNRQPMGQLCPLPSSPAKLDPSFMLSDLPDFTVNGEDEERPSERALANRLAQHAAAEVNDRYALAVKDLVKTLTDIHETELYWEDVRQLDLHERSLTSLHGLSDFCSGVQEMDVSGNSLTQIDGAPASVRQLCARSNRISDLTGWGQFWNLQYLDISANQLTDLSGLAGLVHLREVRADDNQIKSLDGVIEMDGLLKLRLRRNKLTRLDFEHNQLSRLEELDVSGNAITEVRSVSTLSALSSLKLDGNRIGASFHFESSMPHLQLLSLRDCGLQKLDISNACSLRTLIADENHLMRIEGVEGVASLNLLSLRKQTLPAGGCVSILQQSVEARTIRLSENTLPNLHIPQPLLSLQHLELAMVGLQDLPDDFGIAMPNLKTLNLNFNALKDIRALVNIQKLEHLSVCGNRLGRLRKSIATIAKLPTLRSLDLRDNPVTQGLYAASSLAAHPAPTSIVRRAPAKAGVSAEQDVDEDQVSEALTSAKYGLLPAQPNVDQQHCARLDEEAKLRRRVYHLLVGNSCRGIAQLDGLMFDPVAATVKDDIFRRLVELEIVRRSETGGPSS